MTQAAHHLFTFADYLRIEEDNSGTKHEFFAGQVWAMSGGSPEHAAVAANVITLLSVALRGKPCRVYSSDLRLRTATGLGTYPDASVVCGPLFLDPEDPKGHTAVNPTVLVEVLSPSTEAYDLGEKLANYKSIWSLADVVFVAHDRQEVTVVHRNPDGGWSTLVSGKGTIARLPSLGCDLPVDEIYRDPLR